jgi:hypothetical protein
MVGAGGEPNHTAGRKLGPLEIIQSSLWPLWDTQGARDIVTCKKLKVEISCQTLNTPF